MTQFYLVFDTKEQGWPELSKKIVRLSKNEPENVMLGVRQRHFNKNEHDYLYDPSI